MALSKITFTKTNGGLAIPLPGADHVSGMIVYLDTKPAGFDVDIKQITSLVHAESLGIIAGAGDDLISVIHYQISEFFRINKGAELHVMIADEVVTYDFAELKTLQNSLNGKMRQCGIYVHDTAFATSQIASIQTIVDALELEYQPLSVLYAPNIQAVADFTTLPTVHLTSRKVSVVVGADGAGVGKALFTELGYSVAALGACLGAVSKAKVHENIGWVANFQMASSELDVPMLSNGQLMTTVGTTGANALDDKGYLFLVKQPAIAGTYWNYSYTAITATDDYNTIEKNRTIDKAIRGMNASLAPQTNAPLYVDPETGQLSVDTIEYLKSLTGEPLVQMQRDKELSGFEVIIDPSQDVLSTSEVDIEANLVPVGVNKTMAVKVGFKIKLS